MYDPWVDPEEVVHEYGIRVVNDLEEISSSYEAILVAVAHRQFQAFDYERYLAPEGIVYDVKGQVETSCLTYKL